MTEVDTPDNQRGVYNPQVPLATVPGGTASVTVTVPANTETLVILAEMTVASYSVTPTGVTTGLRYPEVRVAEGALPSEHVTTYVECSSALDTEVHLEWGGAPVGTWYVYGDAGIHVVLDPVVSGAVGRTGRATPNGAFLIGGRAPTGLEAVAVNDNGTLYAIPSVPGIAEGDHPETELSRVTIEAAAGAVLIAAPGAGKRLRVFSVNLSTGVATQVLALREGETSHFLAAVCGPGNVALTLPGQGYPLASNTSLGTVFAGAAGTVYGAVYYTTETV